MLQKPNCESGKTFVSSTIFTRFFPSLVIIGNRLIGLYDDQQSDGIWFKD